MDFSKSYDRSFKVEEESNCHQQNKITVYNALFCLCNLKSIVWVLEKWDNKEGIHIISFIIWAGKFDQNYKWLKSRNNFKLSVML